MEEIQIWQAIGIFILCLGVTSATMLLLHRMDQRDKRKRYGPAARRKRDK